RAAAAVVETCTQNLVPSDDLLKSAFDERRADDALKPPSDRDIERRWVRLEAIERPERFLLLRADGAHDSLRTGRTGSRRLKVSRVMRRHQTTLAPRPADAAPFMRENFFSRGRLGGWSPACFSEPASSTAAIFAIVRCWTSSWAASGIPSRRARA